MKASSGNHVIPFHQHHLFHLIMVFSIVAAIYCDSDWWDTFILLSFLIGFYKFINLIITAFQPFLTRRHNLRARYGGGIALVTGGSEGIGLAIAE